ncbi:MAG: thioredoxin-disulfide reductase [Nanoarchaeota archaeon]|nr:thioredoxin-disulfide reductase [Nanoarchaeota archaeon]
MYDVLIIGAGAAGLTAALYASRKKLKTIVISSDIGGQTALPASIENYPGFEKIAGAELMGKIYSQAFKWGAEIIQGHVIKVSEEKKIFNVTLENKKEYKTRALILAAGKIPKLMNVPGEKEFMGRGVSSCVTCDGPFYKDKIAAIVGGGNSAVGGAVELSKIAKKVYLIHRRDEFRADPVEVEKVKTLKNVELVLNSIPVEVKGEQTVQALVVENANSKEQRELLVNGVFVEIGYFVDSEFLKGFLELNERGEIKTDNAGQTSRKGVFAAGDVTTVPFKQTVISAGEGAKAALSAFNYLESQ